MDSGEAVCKELYEKLDDGKRGPDYDYTFGLICAVSGSAEEAEEAYRRAIDAAPGHWEAHFGLAMLLAERDRCKDAYGHLKTALESNPGSARICRELTRVLRLSGDNDFAAAELEQILESGTCGPHRHILQRGLGRACHAAGRYSEAAAAFRNALRQKPLDASLHVNLGTSLLALGRADDAADAFELALSLKPDLPTASGLLAALRSAAGNLRKENETTGGIDSTT